VLQMTKNKMNKREMMVKAHQMAKQMVGDYSARLALALRTLWAAAKKGAKAMKELIVDKDYYSIFGQDQSGSKKMIYNGGISWTAIQGNRTMTMDSQKQTDSAIEYINGPRVNMGSL